MAEAADINRYRQNWQDEVDGTALYVAMADREPDPRLAELYRRLGEVETRHADFWEEQLREAGTPPGERRPSWRARVLALLARRFGANVILPTVAAAEKEGRFMYDHQPETEGTSLRADERSHARLLAQITGPGGPGPGRGMEGGALARLEGRHRAAVGGNALRAMVLGANDGLVSNLSLVMGVAGAALNRGVILVTGLAGLLAGAFSMALGEWISVRSARELAERQLRIEQAEISALPEEEKEELRLIYEAKGLGPEEARLVADRIFEDEQSALEVMAREELGIDPQELGGSAWEAAAFSFALFAVGAIIPVLPYFRLEGRAAVLVSLLLSGFALFGIGAAITVLTGRPLIRSGMRQLLFGVVAAAITFGAGTLLGVSLG